MPFLFEARRTGADIGATMQKHLQNRNWNKYYTNVFLLMEQIFKFRFANITGAPKQRLHQVRNPNLLRRGLSFDSKGQATQRGERLMPSLTQPKGIPFGIREIRKDSAKFGTSVPFAMLLHRGGMILRSRTSIAKERGLGPKFRSLKWTFDPNNRGRAAFPTDEVSPATGQYPKVTSDSAFFMPSRRYLHPLTTHELKMLNHVILSNERDSIRLSLVPVRAR